MAGWERLPAARRRAHLVATARRVGIAGRSLQGGEDAGAAGHQGEHPAGDELADHRIGIRAEPVQERAEGARVTGRTRSRSPRPARRRPVSALANHPPNGAERTRPAHVRARTPWAASPFSRGLYHHHLLECTPRGTFGVVRALTDESVSDRNIEFMRSRFGDRSTYCFLTWVPVVDGQMVPPDWTLGDNVLHTWSR